MSSPYDKKIADLKERELPACMAVGQHEVTPNKLALGDQVDLGGYPYSWATVVYIDAEIVKLVRPYVHVSEWEYGSGGGSKVIDYLGTEPLTFRRADTRKMTVVFRSSVPE